MGQKTETGFTSIVYSFNNPSIVTDDITKRNLNPVLVVMALSL